MPNIRKITFQGVTQSLKAWAAQTKIPAETISSRIDRGWALDRALTEPADERFSRGGRHTPAAPRPCPPMRQHPRKGTAWCRWEEKGRDRSRFFGEWGSAVAKAEYRKFALAWAAGTADADEPGGAAGLTVAELGEKWLDLCEATYVKRGKKTSEVHCVRSALAPLIEVYGREQAAAFDGKKLRGVREAMVERKWKRETVNAHVARLVRMYRWAASEGLVPVKAYESLALVEHIPAGRRADLEEGEGVEPAPLEHIRAVLEGAHLHANPGRRAVLAAMVRVQLLTGMRPGELCGFKAADLDRSRDVWRYEVVEYNKMLHKSIDRSVFFGPEAQLILAPFLAERADGFVFQLPPARKGAAPSPLTPRRYRDYVNAACVSAGVPEWNPNQIRHTTATELMKRFESDKDVAAVLGHSPEVLRQVYAQRPGEEVARRIASLTG